MFILFTTAFVGLMLIATFVAISITLERTSLMIKSKYHSYRFIPKILVVDDEHASVFPLMYVLTKKKAEVVYIKSGLEMIKSLARAQYDLIFLDSSMPELSGELALVESEKIVSIVKQIPVIFYTSKKKIDLPKNLTKFRIKDLWKKEDIESLMTKINTTFWEEFRVAA